MSGHSEKMQIPRHVLSPGPTTEFVPVAEHPETNRAGLGYSILRALGAHERLSWTDLEVIATWSAEYGKTHNVTPNKSYLRGRQFFERVGPRFSADKAAINACRYPGSRKGKPSYAAIFKEVWIDQRWPELCKALAG